MNSRMIVVSGEETFVGNQRIIKEHLGDNINGSSLISRELFRLIVDTDVDIMLDLVKDLNLDRELLAIQKIEGYSNTNNPLLHKFKKGKSSVDFYLTCALDKVPEINRPKTNGLGLEFKKRMYFPIKVMTVWRDNLSKSQTMNYEERDILYKDLVNGTY